MTSQKTIIGTGFSALVASGLLVLAPLGAEAADTPTPEVTVVDSPNWNPYPCPAADTVALCNVRHSVRHRISTRSAGGGGTAVTLGRATPNPR